MLMFIYRPRLSRGVREVLNPASFSQIAALVEPYFDGDPLEHVRVLFDAENGEHVKAGIMSDMFIGESSSIRDLPYNPQATEIYHALYLKNNPDAPIGDGARIYGIAIVFERRVWF